MQIKSFVINLKRRPDRLEKFRAACPLTDVTTIYGFDGKNLQDESEDEQNLAKRVVKLQPGEVGCFISHIRIYQKMINEGIQMALIMEDDAIFCKNFLNQYEDILREMPADADILYIGGRFYPGFRMKSGTRVSEKIVKHSYLQYGEDADRTTHAYIVSLKFAKLAVDTFLANTISKPVDGWILILCFLNNIQIYNAFPLLCHSPAIGDSDIR